MTDRDRFSEWFDKVSEGARASPIGEIMVALGYDVEHTDGGGLSWGRRHGKVLAMICDEGNGLGDSVDEPYFAGLHGDEGDFVECNEMLPNLSAAAEWIDNALKSLAICRKWVAVLGDVFHPDTAGKEYMTLNDAAVAGYEADMKALFAGAGDPYGHVVLAIREAGHVS